MVTWQTRFSKNGHGNTLAPQPLQNLGIPYQEVVPICFHQGSLCVCLTELAKKTLHGFKDQVTKGEMVFAYLSQDTCPSKAGPWRRGCVYVLQS